MESHTAGVGHRWRPADVVRTRSAYNGKSGSTIYSSAVQPVNLLLKESKMHNHQRRLRQRELASQLPAETTLAFDQPYIPGADCEAAFNSNQTLDLYVPSGPGPFPLIIWIHGGGWSQFNKDVDFASQVLSRGFALASLDYRLTSDKFPFPAQIEDCIAALVWLRQSGAQYRVDADRIGLIGHSAGAHLSALLGTIGGANPFASPTGVSTGVQAAVLWSGPLDLGRERGKWPTDSFPWDPDDIFSRLFFPDGVYDEEFAQWASPASYIRAGLPPMLIVHGAEDTIVPPGQAITFAEDLERSGAKVKIRIQEGTGHDLPSPDNHAEALQFFESVLKAP